MAQVVDQNFINSDPTIQRILHDPSLNARNVWFTGLGARDQINQYLASKGLSLPPNYSLTGTGQLANNDPVDWTKVALIGAGAAAPFLLGAAGAAGGADAATSAGAAGGAGGADAGALATIADPGIGAAGVPASIASGSAAAPVATNLGTGALETVGGTAAATGGTTSLWKALAGPAIGAGANVAGSLIQSNQQSKATAAQLQAQQEALAFLKQKYAQTQSQVAPYISTGQGALSALSTGLGVAPIVAAAQAPHVDPLTGPGIPVRNPATSANNGQTMTGTAPPGAAQAALLVAGATAPTAQTGSSVPLNSTQSLSQSGVKLQSPDGTETQVVPANQAQYYIAQGAKVVA